MNSKTTMTFLGAEVESFSFNDNALTISLNREGVLRAVKALAVGEQAESILAEKGITLSMCEKDWLQGNA